MKNIVISTDFSTSYSNTILYALKMMRGQKCNFLILNLPPQEPSRTQGQHEKAKIECLYFESLQRLQKLQKDINRYFPEEDFNLRALTLEELREQVSNISLIMAGTPILRDWRGKMLLDLFRKNTFPLLLIPPELGFTLPRNVLMSLEPNLEIKKATLTPFTKFFGNYKLDLELCIMYANRKNPALEARDEFELAQQFDAYHPKIRKIYTLQIDGVLKMNLEKEHIDFHIIPVTKTTGSSELNSTGFQSSLAGSSVPLMMIHGSEKNELMHFTRSARTRTKTAYPS